MKRKNRLIISLVIAAFLFLVMNTYYIENGFASNLGQAAFSMPGAMGMQVSPDAGSGMEGAALGMAIEFLVLSLVSYLTLGWLGRSFGGRLS